MRHRPYDSPRTPLERAAFAVARGEDPHDREWSQWLELVGGRPCDHPLTGQFAGCLLPCVVQRRDAERLLPTGLELAPQPWVDPEQHLLLFLRGTLQLEAFEPAEIVLVGVPYVQQTSEGAACRGPFLYAPRVYTSPQHPVAQVLERLHGFECVPSRLEVDRDVARVQAEDDGRALAQLVARSRSAPVHPRELDGFDAARALWEMPWVTQASRVGDPQASTDEERLVPFLATSFWLDVAAEACRVAPATAEIRWLDDKAPSALRLAQGVPSLAEHPLGGYTLTAPAGLHRPRSCAEQRYPRPPAFRRQRVVVLGGGPAACAAAFYLAQQGDRFEIDLYTQGWRLGGKCSAGRNTEAHHRIEEHGLHAFLGFYQNAFRTVREASALAGIDLSDGDDPLAGGFQGRLKVGVMDRFEGLWQFFRTRQPYNAQLPGEVPQEAWDYPPFAAVGLLATLDQVRDGLFALLDLDAEAEDDLDATLTRASEQASWWQRIVTDVGHGFDLRGRTLRAALVSLIDHLEDAAAEKLAVQIQERGAVAQGLQWLLGRLRLELKRVLERKIRSDAETWFLWSSVDVMLTCAIGILEEGTLDFDDLDHHDLRGWLLDHGLDPENAQAAAVNQVYETLFAHGEDQPIADQLAAGVGLRWLLLVAFLYSGYPAYEFRYSCPQTILTPLYLAMRKLGVRVHFFHRVTELGIDRGPQGRALRRIHLQRQATVKAGSDGYDPFDPALPPSNPPLRSDWTRDPDWSQLEEGELLRARGINLEDVWAPWPGAGDLELVHGRDFDLCISGIPLTVMQRLAPGLTDPQSPIHCDRWSAAIATASVTHTVSAQLWLKRPAHELYGWDIAMMTGFRAPEPSLADYSHLIQCEGWDPDDCPAFLAYHTGSRLAVSLTAGYPERSPNEAGAFEQQWRDEFEAWLRQHYRELYNRAPAEYDDFLALLAVPNRAEASGVGRLHAQHFHAAHQPSDLYILSRPGSTAHRLGQTESRVRHLVLCGDWTRTDLNCGCVEAAIQSGMLAARAIGNEPRYVWRVGF